MKRAAAAVIMISLASGVFSQVSVREAPSKGYEGRIRDYIGSLKVVDTHEHLLSTGELKKRGALDFTVLLTHYSADDLKSAGMSDRTFRLLIKDSLSADEKWKMLEPYWEASSNTAYNRVALLAADKLYNVNDLNEGTVDRLSRKIRKAYESDWIGEVLDRGKVEYVIQMNPGRTISDKRFRDVIWLDGFIAITSREKISSVAKQRNTTISGVDDLVSIMEATFNDARKNGVIAVKSALAYSRTLYYEEVSREKAADAFSRIISSPDPPTFETCKPLQDYMMHQALDMCRKAKLPYIFHTGLQSGNSNQIENSNPTLLVNLFRKYPDLDFILLHGGYPFGGELSATVKYFRNVYMDLAWIYAISPSFSERYLHEWIETVPVSKIMGFGGDYFTVENLYAHLLFARQILGNVLIAKVRDGYFTEEEAKAAAKKILYDNAIRIYKIKPI